MGSGHGRRLARPLWRGREVVLFAATTLLLAVGGALWLAGAQAAASGVWVAATLIGLVHSTATLFAAARRRQPSVDVIAWLALAGALLVGEAFAGAVIAVMLASGVLLEARAAARARRELSLLAARAPRTARRYGPDGLLEVRVDEVAPGDRLLVGSGEIVPVDGRLLSAATLDESALSGEGLPVERRAGEDVRSGLPGATASAEAADVVLTVDRADALADAILIARRARRIAWRAVFTGMGLALAAMVAAAAGQLPPAAGAALQEVIDVAAIGIALTALLPARAYTARMAPADVATARRLYAQHQSVRPLVERIRSVADDLGPAGRDVAAVRELLGRLESDLLPHERAEEAELVPILARALGGRPRPRPTPDLAAAPAPAGTGGGD